MFIKSVVVAWEEDKNWVHFDVGLHLGTSSMVCACVLKSCNVLFSAHLQSEREAEQDRRKGIKKSAATHPSRGATTIRLYHSRDYAGKGKEGVSSALIEDKQEDMDVSLTFCHFP